MRREDRLYNVSDLHVLSFLQHWFSIRGDVPRAHLVISVYIFDYRNLGSVLLASGGLYKDTAVYPIVHSISFQSKGFPSPKCQ